MDIFPLAMTVFGAFGAGVTVGALVFSPRLVTWSDTGGRADHRGPAVVYVTPGDPSPVIPPGYTVAPIPSGDPRDVTPAVLFAALGNPGVNPEQIPGRPTRNDRDSDPGQDLRSITPPGASPGTTPKWAEGHR